MHVGLTVGEYTLTANTETKELWLDNKGGEGMALVEAELEKMLDEYFKENF